MTKCTNRTWAVNKEDCKDTSLTCVPLYNSTLVNDSCISNLSKA